MDNAAESLQDADWFTSSYSNNQGGECVECASLAGDAIAVRDSKDPDGPAFVFGRDAWLSFIAILEDGVFEG
jgi:hypothetical protein